MLFVISFDTNLIIRGIWSFLYVVFDNRLIGIRSNWEPTIRIVKIAIRFSINNYRLHTNKSNSQFCTTLGKSFM